MVNNFFILLFAKLTDFLFSWQTLVGSVIGAITPLFILWLAEKSKKRRGDKDYLYYLQRIIVDQINAVIDMEATITFFLESRLKNLLQNIENNPSNAYSVDGTFFPLFSVRTIPSEVHTKSSRSGYIDNKVGKVYAMSQDFPHIIEDIRLQLIDTLERNEKIAFGRMNPPEVQKEQYKRNIQEYQKMLREDLLKKNIPLYLKKLVETLVAVREKTTSPYIIWKLKFDPRWKFYYKKENFARAKNEIMETMDAYFKPAVDRQIKEIRNQN